MLAAALEHPNQLRFPILASPKLDGIRCLIIDGLGPVTRTFKPIPNTYIAALLSKLPNGLDGELMVKSDSFSDVQSAVMCRSGNPEFTYFVFDYVIDLNEPFIDRVKRLENLSLPNFCQKVQQTFISNQAELDQYEQECLTNGYEGVMIRSLNSPYKCGRSTEREGYLLKVKRFVDSEAIILGFEEQFANTNTEEYDAFGKIKRSTKLKGMVPKNTLGALQVRDLKTNIEFNISTGMDDAQRKYIWNNRANFLHKIIKYKYQPVGALEKPRFPVFLGIRDERDL
jgi:DNA ligase-1